MIYDVEQGYWLSRRWRDAYLVWKSGLENAIMLYMRQGVNAKEEEQRDMSRQRDRNSDGEMRCLPG